MSVYPNGLPIKKGDRVHVEFDGVVDAANSTFGNCWDVQVSPDGLTGHVFIRHEHVTRIEPEYEVGAHYIDGTNQVWMRTSGGRWVRAGDNGIYPNVRAARPLRKLVPEA